MKPRTLAICLSVAVLTSTLLLTATAAQAGSKAPMIKRGGSLNVALVSLQWPNLDPATDTVEGIHIEIMDAIYGALFEQGSYRKYHS